MKISGEFISGSAGRILVVLHEPLESTGRWLLVAPAFGEEMNKSRRLIWQVGRSLAAAEHHTLVVDLFGTGDSEGEFSDARWSIWAEDLQCALDWAKRRGALRFSALAVRLGAALFADVVDRGNLAFEKAVVWQGVRSGGDTLRQLLRMKRMATRMSGRPTAAMETMEAELLASSTPMELGGYRVHSELAKAINAASFSAARVPVGKGLALELGPSQPTNDLSGLQSGAEDWQTACVGGERFWLATEPGDNPELIRETVSFLTAPS